MAFVMRQLGASVGDNLQCAHDAHLSGPLDLISIDDNVGDFGPFSKGCLLLLLSLWACG
jgi:hypothetical protein